MRSQNPQKKFLRSFCLTKKKCNCAEYMFDLLRYYFQAISIFLLQPLKNFLLGEKIITRKLYSQYCSNCGITCVQYLFMLYKKIKT